MCNPNESESIMTYQERVLEILTKHSIACPQSAMDELDKLMQDVWSEGYDMGAENTVQEWNI